MRCRLQLTIDTEIRAKRNNIILLSVNHPWPILVASKRQNISVQGQPKRGESCLCLGVKKTHKVDGTVGTKIKLY